MKSTLQRNQTSLIRQKYAQVDVPPTKNFELTLMETSLVSVASGS